jgi:protein dithiol oxidoreductase (disulfide-forming)
MSRRFLFALLALLPLLASAQSAAPTEPRLNTDYEVLATPAPAYNPTPGKVQVIEVFGYTCIHCAHFEPMLSAWKAEKMPAGAKLDYLPGAFGSPWNEFARAYFAAEQLKVLDKTHARIFKAVHEDRAFQNGNLEEIATYYAKLGVDRGTFLAAMQSPATEAKLKAARDYATAVDIQGTPTVIVAGKYKLMVTRDRGFEGMLATADFLIARELAAAKRAKPVKPVKKP